MRCRLVFSCFVVLSGFLVVSCRVFVMLCCLVMMLCCLKFPPTGCHERNRVNSSTTLWRRYRKLPDSPWFLRRQHHKNEGEGYLYKSRHIRILVAFSAARKLLVLV